MRAILALMLLAYLGLAGCAPVASRDLREQPYQPGWDDEVDWNRQALARGDQQPKHHPEMFR